MLTMASDGNSNLRDVDAYDGRELDLVREVLRGSPAAIERFAGYLANVPAIVAVHRRHTSLPIAEQEVPDLVQDCLSVVWRKLPEYQGRAALSTWIFRVCSYELSNAFRRLARVRRVGQLAARTADGLTTAEPPIEQRVPLEIDLRDGLRHLSPDHREVIELHLFDGCTLEQVARKLGSKVSQVKTLYYKALERLHDYLDQRDFGDAKS
jgi:RNA polymerase sigma-70 factor (ECF subfamily)